MVALVLTKGKLLLLGLLKAPTLFSALAFLGRVLEPLRLAFRAGRGGGDLRPRDRPRLRAVPLRHPRVGAHVPPGPGRVRAPRADQRSAPGRARRDRGADLGPGGRSRGGGRRARHPLGPVGRDRPLRGLAEPREPAARRPPGRRPRVPLAVAHRALDRRGGVRRHLVGHARDAGRRPRDRLRGPGRPSRSRRPAATAKDWCAISVRVSCWRRSRSSCTRPSRAERSLRAGGRRRPPSSRTRSASARRPRPPAGRPASPRCRRRGPDGWRRAAPPLPADARGS